MKDKRDQGNAPSAPREGSSDSENPNPQSSNSEGSIAERRDPYQAFRSRSYLLFFLGALVSSIGNQMQNVAVGWEIYSRVSGQQGAAELAIKQGALALGIVGLVQALPVIFLALPAGHLADRYDRRRVIAYSQLLLAACWVGLAYVSFTKGPLAWFYFFLLLDGIANALTGPARSALTPQLVDEEVIPNAMMWNSARTQVASTVGPALGGAAIAFFAAPSPVYLIAVGTALLFAVSTNFLHPRLFERTRDRLSLDTLLMGARFVWNTPLILATVTLDMFAVLLGGAVALLPVFAKDILFAGPVGYGWLLAAQAIGALAASLAIAHLPPMHRAGKALLWAVGGFGVSTILFGISRNFYLSFAALFLCGSFDAISVVVRHTLVQVLTPDHLRGRVSAINSVFIGISNELGSFESGAVARLIGPVAAVILGGAGTVGVALGVGWKWPVVRQLGSLQDAVRENTEESSEQQSTGKVLEG